jgi:cAMP-dependent protein kinase regulator
MSVPRAAVSAEVYGFFNKKENFKPRKIEKTEEQIQRIKARILQSFLFQNLEANDLNIVIDAMEERKVE